MNNNANKMMKLIVDSLESLDHEDLYEISLESGVSFSTLYYWKQGVIESPRLCNFIAVAEILGFSIIIMKGAE